MALYALVQGGVVLEYRTVAPNVDQTKINRSKPKLLPVEVENETYDPVSQVREPYAVVVEASRVVHRYTVRAKNEDEVAAMKDAKEEEIEREFQRLCQAPIAFSVGGQEYQWHADQEAIRNVTGCLQAYNEGPPIGINPDDPRTWSPVDSFVPVTISRNELRGLGLAIAARKDALFFTKKSKQFAVTQLTDPADIDAYEVTKGWE